MFSMACMKQCNAEVKIYMIIGTSNISLLLNNLLQITRTNYIHILDHTNTMVFMKHTVSFFKERLFCMQTNFDFDSLMYFGLDKC